MGNYKCRQPGYLSAQQICICEDTFQGKSDDWIIENRYHVYDKNDKKAVANAKSKLRKLRKNPKFIEYYNSIVTEFRVHGYGKAMNKMVDLIDNDNPWLALQAAVNVVSKTEKIVTGDEENAVTVKIEGLPELGTPSVSAVESET